MDYINRSILLFCWLLMVMFASEGIVAASESNGASIKVMSFNIMYDRYYGKPSTDPNAWNCVSGHGRKDRVIRMIMAQEPDIIGVQETIQNQADDLKNAIKGYDCCGVVGKTGCEACRVFYRSERFTKLDSGTFWLSHTPDVPGSICPGAAHPRIGSWVKLRDCRNQKSYFVLNTHFDYKNAAANTYSAGLIRDKIAALSEGAPVIVMGDLNTKETADAYLKLTGRQDPNEFQLTDTYRYIYPAVKDDEKTWHGFKSGTHGSRIDYIFVNSGFNTTAATIDRNKVLDNYPSDHYPVTATIYCSQTRERHKEN